MLTVLDTFYLQSLQQQLQFPLATLEWCWVDVIYTISEVAVKDITRGLCLENMVVKTTHAWRALEIGPTGHGYQTYNTACPWWNSLYVAFIILMENCCVPVVCFMNDQNDLILHLLQVPPASYGALQKYLNNKHLIEDCKACKIFCRMEWCLHDYV
jgi:hypothetical protein